MVNKMAGKKPSLKKSETQVQEPANPGNVEEVVVGGADSVLDDLEAELSGISLDGTMLPPEKTTTMLEDLKNLDAELEAAGPVLTQEQVNADALADAQLTQMPAPAANPSVEKLRELAKEEQAENKAPEPAKPAEEGKKGTAPVTKRIATMGMKKSEALVKALGNRAADFLTINLSDAELPDEQRQAKINELLATIDDSKKTPIKIQEKVINFYAHLSNGAQLSNYTKMAIELLVKDGELTSKGLKDAYEARPYSPGTASSQATQMMKLLPLLGLAKREGQKLIVNPDSVLLPSLNIA